MGVGSWLVPVLARVVCSIVQARGRAVRPEGRAALQLLAETVIRARSRVVVSEQVRVLAGFDRQIRADENCVAGFLSGERRQVLAVVNHFADCPLGVVGNAIMVAYGLRTTFGVEPTIIFGMGASVVTLLRERASRVTDIVMVGGPRIRVGKLNLLDMRRSTSQEVLAQLLNGRSVTIYPERTNSRELLRGDFRAGRIILHAVEEGIDVVPVGVHYSDGAFHMGIGRLLDRSHILGFGASTNRGLAGQDIVDYAMREIAGQLPHRLAGAYAYARPLLPTESPAID